MPHLHLHINFIIFNLAIGRRDQGYKSSCAHCVARVRRRYPFALTPPTERYFLESLAIGYCPYYAVQKSLGKNPFVAVVLCSPSVFQGRSFCLGLSLTLRRSSAMQTLATFIHISDLHIGGPLNSSLRDTCLGSKALANFPLLDGILGHNYEACGALCKFCRETRGKATEGPVGLIVTGDLTRCGSGSEFCSSLDFIGNKTNSLDDLSPLPIGLGGQDHDLPGNPRWDLASNPGSGEFSFPVIPGNHDHWAGYTFPPGPPDAIWQHLKKDSFPFCSPQVNLTNGLDKPIRFMGINTDADVSWWGINRWLARGAFRSQVDRLSEQLEKLSEQQEKLSEQQEKLSEQQEKLSEQQEEEIRVLLLHHCRLYKNEENNGGKYQNEENNGADLRLRARLAEKARRLEVVDPPRHKLEEFIDRWNISVILSGHTHEPQVTCSDINGREVLDARCGTTTQIDPARALSRKEFEALKKCLNKDERKKVTKRKTNNALLLHKLCRDNGTLEWHTRTYVRPEGGGFEEGPTVDQKNRPLVGSLRL